VVLVFAFFLNNIRNDIARAALAFGEEMGVRR
jgi:hypothetical protein